MDKKFNAIKKTLQKIIFDIDIDPGNDFVTVAKKYGGFLFEFTVGYDKITYNYIGSDYLSPEEGTYLYTFTFIEDLYVYDKKLDVIEFSDIELNELINILEEKIIGQQKTITT